MVLKVSGDPEEISGEPIVTETIPSFDSVNCEELFLVTVTPVPPVKVISFKIPALLSKLRLVVLFGTE